MTSWKLDSILDFSFPNPLPLPSHSPIIKLIFSKGLLYANAKAGFKISKQEIKNLLFIVIGV